MRIVCVAAGIICFMLMGADVIAQPGLPTPPARPVPWGSLPVIIAGCVGYALWQVQKFNR